MRVSGSKRHTDKTGDISEAAIIMRLLQSGYVVLTPYGKNHRYDLMIEDAEGRVWRVQCKTGWMDEEQTTVSFATASSYNHTAKQKGWRHYRGQIDFFAVYCEGLNKVYLVPVDSVGITWAKLSPTVVDDRREHFGVCNGRAARELDAHVASMTKSGDRQKRETVYLQDERKAAGFRRH